MDLASGRARGLEAACEALKQLQVYHHQTLDEHVDLQLPESLRYTIVHMFDPLTSDNVNYETLFDAGRRGLLTPHSYRNTPSCALPLGLSCTQGSHRYDCAG